MSRPRKKVYSDTYRATRHYNPRSAAELLEHDVAELGWRLVHTDGHYRAERDGYASVRAATPERLLEKLAYANAYRARFNKPASPPPPAPEPGDGIAA